MPNGCGIGGDAFWLVWDEAAGEQVALNGSGRAPAGVDPERLRAGGLDRIPLRGPLSITVPGVVRSWADAHRRWGRLSRDAVLAAAVEHAAAGFPAWDGLIDAIESTDADIGDEPWTAGFRRVWRPRRTTVAAGRDRPPARPRGDAAHAGRRGLRRVLRRRPRRARRPRAGGGRRLAYRTRPAGAPEHVGRPDLDDISRRPRHDPPAQQQRHPRPRDPQRPRAVRTSGGRPFRGPRLDARRLDPHAARGRQARLRGPRRATSRTRRSATSRWTCCCRRSARRSWPPVSTPASPIPRHRRPAPSSAGRSTWPSWTRRATPSA